MFNGFNSETRNPITVDDDISKYSIKTFIYFNLYFSFRNFLPKKKKKNNKNAV